MNSNEIDEKVKFYNNGYLKINLSKNKSYYEIIKFLEKVDNIDLSNNKNFIKTYNKTFDLNYDSKINNPLFYKFVIDQKIPDQISDLMGTKYVLGDFTIRKTYLKKSYMNWHRDTYLRNNHEVVGRIPPLIKFIFYPNFKNDKLWQLKILPQSHKKIFMNKYFDLLQVYFTKNKVFFNTNDSAVLFDSSCMHAAAPNKSDNGSFRLIFNFCLESQINTFSSGTGIANKFLTL